MGFTRSLAWVSMTGWGRLHVSFREVALGSLMHKEAKSEQPSDWLPELSVRHPLSGSDVGSPERDEQRHPGSSFLARRSSASFSVMFPIPHVHFWGGWKGPG